MHFSQVTSTMLALGAGLASAVDVRLYYSNDCSGNYLVCSNLGANVCCTGTSVSLYWVVNRSLDARGFAGGNCGELRSARRTSSSFCMPGTGVVYTGGRWVVPASLRVRDQDVCAAGVGKCDAVQKPDTLVLADGSKFKALLTVRTVIQEAALWQVDGYDVEGGLGTPHLMSSILGGLLQLALLSNVIGIAKDSPVMLDVVARNCFIEVPMCSPESAHHMIYT
ncbi:hypothetical protein RB596_003929 [Gaeumannomyces avenae]